MMRVVLIVIILVTFGLGLPIDSATNNHQEEESSDEIILIPYQVTFVPVEVSLHPKTSSSKNQPTVAIIKNPNHADHKTEKSKTDERTKNNEREPTFDLFKEKFNEDLPSSAEDLVWMPISTLKRLEDDGTESAVHSITKRQAPGRNFRGNSFNARYRPRFALVGYLNDYDDFPTLS